MNEAPLQYLSTAGARALIATPLLWFTLCVSILVCLVIGALVWRGTRGAVARGDADAVRSVTVERGGDGLRWIRVGLWLSAAPLAVTLVWTMTALARMGPAGIDTVLTIDVTPRQWWWEVEYPAAQMPDRIVTANEIHVPAGQPVLLRLHGGDVIHSFWVPQLSGKLDAIPGQVNTTWLRANAPGRYRGQCAEFCGDQHAHMAFEVVADLPPDFDRWLAGQRRPASEPTGDAARRGKAVVEFRCGLCHAVRGTDAAARSAPDLTHLMSRRYLAGATLPNARGTLMGWVLHPQAFKLGNRMPEQALPGDELADVVTYLETLR